MIRDIALLTPRSSVGVLTDIVDALEKTRAEGYRSIYMTLNGIEPPLRNVVDYMQHPVVWDLAKRIEIDERIEPLLGRIAHLVDRLARGPYQSSFVWQTVDTLSDCHAALLAFHRHLKDDAELALSPSDEMLAKSRRSLELLARARDQTFCIESVMIPDEDYEVLARTWVRSQWHAREVWSMTLLGVICVDVLVVLGALLGSFPAFAPLLVIGAWITWVQFRVLHSLRESVGPDDRFGRIDGCGDTSFSRDIRAMHRVSPETS